MTAATAVRLSSGSIYGDIKRKKKKKNNTPDRGLLTP
jgi:hypothetical protein